MTRMKRFAETWLIFGVLLASAAATAGTPDYNAIKANGAQAVLEALDKRHNDYSTQKWEFQMTLQPKSGAKRVVSFNVWQKGSKRLVRFDSGDVKGMAVLSKGADNMWVYSPAETGGSVRRVSSSAKRQGLLGSDFGAEEMAMINLADDYTAELGADSGGTAKLILKRKGGSEVSWPELHLVVDTKLFMIKQIDYVEDGETKKVQTRTQFSTDGGAPVWKHVVMTTRSSGHSTTLEMKSQVIGEDIPDKIFSKRTLVRGN